MIKEGEKNRGKWKIGIIRNICMGMDNTIRLISIRTRKSIIERPLQMVYPMEMVYPIQMVYPMELHYDSKSTTNNTQDHKNFNVNAEEFRQNSRSCSS